MGAGERFQQETKYSRDSLGGNALDWSSRPAPVKHYGPDVPCIPLPKPVQLDGPAEDSLWTAIARRRSRRVYDRDAVLPMDSLAALLWATQGVTAKRGPAGFRSAPSAGALYPIETYCLCRRVGGLAEGVYHFRPEEFDVEMIRAGDFAEPCAMAALGQSMAADAQVTVIWTAVIGRSTWKYRERAYRYIYLDAGHIAQNLYLGAEVLGLGVCGIGAFFDDEMNGILGVDGASETVVYLATVGIMGGGTTGGAAGRVMGGRR